MVMRLTERELEEKVRAAVKEVMDPELGASLVDLGMIKGIRVKGEKVEIDLALTTPFCPLAHSMVASVKQKAESVEGIREAIVRVVGYGPSKFPT